jgi:hypothetical protein
MDEFKTAEKEEASFCGQNLTFSNTRGPQTCSVRTVPVVPCGVLRQPNPQPIAGKPYEAVHFSEQALLICQ